MAVRKYKSGKIPTLAEIRAKVGCPTCDVDAGMKCLNKQDVEVDYVHNARLKEFAELEGEDEEPLVLSGEQGQAESIRRALNSKADDIVRRNLVADVLIMMVAFESNTINREEARHPGVKRDAYQVRILAHERVLKKLADRLVDMDLDIQILLSTK